MKHQEIFDRMAAEAGKRKIVPVVITLKDKAGLDVWKTAGTFDEVTQTIRVVGVGIWRWRDTFKVFWSKGYKEVVRADLDFPESGDQKIYPARIYV